MLTLEDARRISERITTPSTKHMTPQHRLDGVCEMLDELGRLAKKDGCAAAAWALEWIIEATKGEN